MNFPQVNGPNSPSTASQLCGIRVYIKKWKPSGIYYNIHAFQGPASSGTVCWASPNGDEIVVNQDKSQKFRAPKTGTFKKGIGLQLSPNILL